MILIDFIMLPFKKANSQCTNRKQVNLLFLFSALFILTYLSLSNYSWFPWRITISSYSNKPVKLDIPRGSNNFSFAEHTYKYIINEPDKCKEDVPFLVLLVTVERWQKEARQAIRQTWGNENFIPGVRILRLFLLGNDVRQTAKDEQALMTESEAFHDIIQQDYLDTYQNLTIKVLMGLGWVVTYCPQALYIMKTDSDMFVNTEYLVKTLLKPDQPPKMKYFTGYLMLNAKPIRDINSKWYMPQDVYPEDDYPPFCSGTGYVLSGDLAQMIVNVSSSVQYVHLEDVYIGLCLDKIGVKPVASPKESDFNAWPVSFSDCGYHQIVTSHMLSPGVIIHYWNRLQQNKHHCG